MKFQWLRLSVLIATSIISVNLYAQTKEFTEYSDGVRIRNSSVTTAFFDPAEYARWIKERTSANWIEISSLRRRLLPAALHLLGNPFHATDLKVEFVIKKGGAYFTAICEPIYWTDNGHLYTDDGCKWWNQDGQGVNYTPFAGNGSLVLTTAKQVIPKYSEPVLEK